MDSMLAIQRAQIARATGERGRVFDWDKAARLIVERRPEEASAGLGEDWEFTGGVIYVRGDVVTEDYTYLSSNWAVPQLDMDGEVVACWVYMKESPGWDAKTSWPDSALAIIEAGEG